MSLLNPREKGRELKMKKTIFVLSLYFAFTILMTYPLFFKINTHIPGFFSTDEPFTSLWDFWRIKYSLDNSISLKHTPLIAYPFGIDINPFGLISYIWPILNFLLAIFTSPALSWNIQIFLNLTLCGFFTYLLTYFLTKNNFAAFLSGVIFAFLPYQFIRAWQHLGLTYNQWIPLCLFTAILLKEKLSIKYVILFSLSIVILFSFDFSIMFFGLIALLSFFLYTSFYRWEVKFTQQKELFLTDLSYFKKVIISALISFIILLPMLFVIVKGRILVSPATQAAPSNLFHRPFEDLFSQSARPLSYLLPSPVHPIFGKFTELFLGSSLYGISFTEHMLYLGWTALVLAFFAFLRWKKNRKLFLAGQRLSARENFYIGFFIFMALTGWLLTQPPWWKIGPLKIYMPSFFMYKIIPMFRAYSRFAILVMLAIAVLAGFQAKFILERFKKQISKITVTSLLCGLILFEFWNYPPFKIIDVSRVPAVYYWLRDQPQDFVLAEYPLDIQTSNDMYEFYQTKHNKKIINSTRLGTSGNQVARLTAKLSQPDTPRILRWLGVKYVLVHKEDYLKTELIEEIEELDKIPHNPGLKLIKSFPAQDCPRKDILCTEKTGPIDVYEVTASPLQPKIEGNNF